MKEHEKRQDIGTLEQLEQGDFSTASHIFESSKSRGEYIASLHFYRQGRRQFFTWSHDRKIADVEHFALIFWIYPQRFIRYESLVDFKKVDEFEFLLISRYCAALKIALQGKEYCYCTGIGQEKMEQFVLCFDSSVEGDNEGTVFISKVMQHQAELLISAHDELTWEQDEEFLSFTSILAHAMSEEIGYAQ